MDVIEIAAPSAAEQAALIDGEREPWGPLGERLRWREKDRRVGIRAGDGRLLATAGAVLAEVSIERRGRFQVVGLGGLFVTRRARGTGLLERLVGPLIEIAAAMGPEVAMLFCRPELVERYRDHGFVEIAAPVWVDQPEGRVEMPLCSMWRALRDGAGWPPGRVDVHGLPF
jgi:GNAT superfamily N-acetyltransferase